jgi:hypothetical protein
MPQSPSSRRRCSDVVAGGDDSKQIRVVSGAGGVLVGEHVGDDDGSLLGLSDSLDNREGWEEGIGMQCSEKARLVPQDKWPKTRAVPAS